MTLAGWVFMLVSVTSMTVLVFWCFRRVLSFRQEPSEPVKQFHSA